MLDAFRAASAGADIVAALAAAADLYLPLAAVPAAAGIDAESAAAAVADLVESGWVELWPECPDGPALCLSPLGFARMAVATGLGFPAEPELPALPDHVPLGVRVVVERSPGPAVLAERREESIAAAHAAARQTRVGATVHRVELPYPTVILTGPALAWDEAGVTRRYPVAGPLRKRLSKRRTHDVVTTPRAPCPVCKGLWLAPEVCCARCSRWGLDHLLPRSHAARKEAS